MSCHATLLLAAGRNRLDVLNTDNWRELQRLRNDQLFESLVFLISAGVLLWVITRLWRRIEQRRRRKSPWALFFELCRAHRLAWRDRLFLFRLARAEGLAQPALVFIAPRLLSDDWVARFDPRQRERGARIRSILFAGLDQTAMHKHASAGSAGSTNALA